MKPDLKIRMVRIRGDVNVVQEGSKKQKWTGYQQTGAWLLIPPVELETYQTLGPNEGGNWSELRSKRRTSTNEHIEVQT